MNTNELRIGNYVLLNDYGSENELVEVFKLDSEQVNFVNKRFCLPITLTEDWLIKFGFVYNKVFDEYVINLKDNIPLSIDVDGNVTIGDEYNSPYFPNCILGVHQLQNLYFSLTGKELTLKNE